VHVSHACKDANSLGWNEQDRPQGLGQFVGNTAAVNVLVQTLRLFRDRPQDYPAPCIFMEGPPGVGKTTIALLLLRQAGYDPTEINASDARSANDMRTCVNVTAAASQWGRPNATIVDEVDGCSGVGFEESSSSSSASSSDESGIQVILKWIKERCNPKKRPSTRTNPIIFIANDMHSKQLRDLATACVRRVRFYKLDQREMDKLMTRTATKHHISLTPAQCAQISSSAKGDARKLISQIEWLHNSTSQVSDAASQSSLASGAAPTCKPVGNAAAASDNFEISFDQIARLLHGTGAMYYKKGPDGRISDEPVITQYDSTLLPLMVHQNWPSMQWTTTTGIPQKPRQHSGGGGFGGGSLSSSSSSSTVLANQLEITDMLADMDVMGTKCWQDSVEGGDGGVSGADLSEWICTTTMRRHVIQSQPSSSSSSSSSPSQRHNPGNNSRSQQPTKPHVEWPAHFDKSNLAKRRKSKLDHLFQEIVSSEFQGEVDADADEGDRPVRPDTRCALMSTGFALDLPVMFPQMHAFSAAAFTGTETSNG
jgi:DNA polymerase III delta prime subunit